MKIFLWAILFAARATLAGNEVGGNGDRVSAWLVAQAREVVEEARRQETLGHPIIAGVSAAALERALGIPVVLVHAANRRQLENAFGEFKDVKVITRPSPALLVDGVTWTASYNANRRDHRAVLHAYLYAAGFDDRDYRFSSAADLGALEAANVCRAEKKHWQEGWRTVYARELRLPTGWNVERALALEPELGFALTHDGGLATLELFSYKRSFVLARIAFTMGSPRAELSHRLDESAVLEITCRRE